MGAATSDEGRLARTGEEYKALAASEADWIVRCPDDLRRRRGEDGSPLARLTAADFDAFVAGLGFAGGAVAHGSYRPLMTALTITEIFEVFASFGMHRDYVLRILEFECVHPPDAGHADCEFSFWSFCSSMCDIVVFPPT